MNFIGSPSPALSAAFVAQVREQWNGDGTQWTVGGRWHYIDDDTRFKLAKTAAEAAVGDGE